MKRSKAQRELLKSAFRPLELDENKHSFFFDAWDTAEFPKGTYVTELGEVEHYFYVVVSGVQCIYTLGLDGEKKVIGFSFDGSFSGIYDSFVKATPSNYFLEALTDTRLLRISLSDFNQLYTLYPEFEHWGRVVHLELLIGRVNREVELITQSAQERFEGFMNRLPAALEAIPQKYLASYLNMTPETFSRIRRKTVGK